jgi:hypothetical protein
MREWLFVLVPVVFVIYYLLYPANFDAALSWISRFVN